MNHRQASAGCRYSFVPMVVRGCCCTFLLYHGAAPAPTRVTGWLQMLMDGRGRVWLVRMVPVRVPGGGCSCRTPPSCKSFRKRSLMWLPVKGAVSAAGHVIVDMADFPAADQPAAQLCAERVRGCDVYVGVLGTRYGSPVRDRPEVSYTELEFDTATEADLDRLVFVLDTEAADVGIPPSALIDREYGARQDAFRRRVQDSGLVTRSFASPAELGS